MADKRIIIPNTEQKNNSVNLLQYISVEDNINYDAFVSEYAIIYILSGKKHIQIDGNKYTINKGELFFISKGVYTMSEYITEKEPFKSIVLFFSPKISQNILDNIAKYTSDIITNTDENLLIIKSNSDVQQIFTSIETYTINYNPLLTELIKLKFTELVYILISSPHKKKILSFLYQAAKQSEMDISIVLDRYMYSSIKISELAILSGRSISKFKRDFALLYNEAPRKWLNKKRLEHAAFLLNTSIKNIDQISDECGFINQTHFARLFKQTYLFPPSEYRIKQREK